VKKFLIVCLLSVGIPLGVHASSAPSLLQIAVFDWNTETKRLEVQSLGSGTAIESDLVLTNKHVVTLKDGTTADFVLICPAQSKSTHSVQCNIPAAVVAVHPKFDAALIRPMDSEVYLPRVRTALQIGSAGEHVRVYGFPRPIEDLQNFGGTRTMENIKKWQEVGGEIEAKGDALTITRGKIKIVAQRKDTGEMYYMTDVKVNYGNSGGAAFDETGVFIGIPTLKDTESNALILTYPQLAEWVSFNRINPAQIADDVWKFYSQQVKVQKENISVTGSPINWQQERRAPSKDTRNTKGTTKQKKVAPIRTTYFRSRR
jgi:hypothetical protein